MKPNSKLAPLSVLYAAAFVAAFNENAVNVALVDIMSEFDIGSVTAQWLVTGYMIVTSVVVALSAFLSRRFALRPLFTAAAVLLSGGCVLAMLAPSFPALMAFRLMQACGTGLFIPLMMTSVLRLAPADRVGRYMALGSCCITLGPAFGPAVSGCMVTLLGWRFAFLPTALATAALAVAGLVVLERGGAQRGLSVDPLSVASAAAGLTSLSYGLTLLMADPVRCAAFVGLGVLLIVAFGLRQKKLEEPLLDMGPLRNARFCVCCLLAMLGMMTTFSMSVLLPLYFQGAAGLSALLAGLLILVPIAFNAATSVIGGRVMDGRGPFPLIFAGFVLIVVGQIATCAASCSTMLLPVVASAALTYAGVGLVLSPSQTLGLKGLSPDEAPHGVSILNVFVQVAACLGPALYVGLMSTGAEGAVAAGMGAAAAQAAGFKDAVFVAVFVGLAGAAVSLWATLPRAGEDGEEAHADREARSPLAGIMKTDVYVLGEGQTVLDAMRLFREKGISAAPVVDERGELCGFVSDGDVMRCLARQVPMLKSALLFADEQRSEDFDENLSRAVQLPLGSICKKRVIAVNLEDSLPDVARTLAENHLRKAPVMHEGRMVGVINRSNITRYAIERCLEQRKGALE